MTLETINELLRRQFTNTDLVYCSEQRKPTQTRHMYTQTDRQIHVHRQTDRQTHVYIADRQTDRLID